MTIVAYAVKDISHWFNGDDWIQYTHPIVGTVGPRLPYGPGHHQPEVPSTKWRPLEKPWWLDQDLVIGKMTVKTRPIRITNTLINSTVTLEVCSEETIAQIMLRYLPHNSHFMSYTWRYLDRPLSLDQTLAENGIEDERETFSDFALPENLFIPAILLYYNDDLTEDIPNNVCLCQEPSCREKHPNINCHSGA